MSAPAQSTNLVIALDAVLLFGACGKHSQTAFASYRKDDAPAYKGAEGDPFVAENWTLDDRASWENQIRAHGQYQNGYNKMP